MRISRLTINLFPFLSDSPSSFKLLHWASFLVSTCGVVFLLLGRGHYSIDVILAYFVTTRIWWIYHTLANNSTLRTSGDHNLLANECWWHAFRSAFKSPWILSDKDTCFRWFEGKTKGPLPRKYNLPLPKFIKRFFVRKFRGMRRDNSVSGEEF